MVVVGAGPGGLGAAGILTQSGLRTVLLERGPGVGNKWRETYDRLQINTSTLTSYLPGCRFPRSVGLWASRDQLVSYYEAFAAARHLDVRTDVEVRSVQRNGPSWRVVTTTGDMAATHVVVAVGRDRVPVIPDWLGTEDFSGALIHASEYRNAARFRGARALVVGVGNSGADIALDLLDGGAATVSVAVRTAPHIIKRSVAGVPNDLLQVLTRRVPTAMVDAAGELIRRRSYGDLESLGLQRPPVGVKTYVKTQARVPTIDAGPFSVAVRSRRIRIVPGLHHVHEGDAVLEDGSRLPVDLIVAATGYKPGLEPLIGHLGALDDRGWPTFSPYVSDASWPGLYVLGFGDPTRGNLRGLRLDAITAARQIKARGGQQR